MATSFKGVNAIATIPGSVADRLRETMVLGMPTVDSDKPKFYFSHILEWDQHDSEGKPWNWEVAPEDPLAPVEPVQVICAYEFFAPLGRTGAQFTEVGDFHTSTVVFTLLKPEYLQIVGSSYVTVGPRNTRWWFRYWQPQVALGAMDVYQAHFQAEDTK